MAPLLLFPSRFENCGGCFSPTLTWTYPASCSIRMLLPGICTVCGLLSWVVHAKAHRADLTLALHSGSPMQASSFPTVLCSEVWGSLLSHSPRAPLLPVFSLTDTSIRLAVGELPSSAWILGLVGIPCHPILLSAVHEFFTLLFSCSGIFVGISEFPIIMLWPLFQNEGITFLLSLQ